MIEVRKTAEFEKWLARLRDIQTRERIISRVIGLANGHPGDNKYVGESVWELRLHFGSGYRVYYTHCGQEWILLLIGGDKSSQEKDILLAQKMAKKERGNHGQA